MNLFQYLFFDCMETLIELDGWHTADDDARWAYEGSGTEEYWKGFADFLTDYRAAKDYFTDVHPAHQEYDIIERFRYMVEARLPRLNRHEQEDITVRLMTNFWEHYKTNTFIADDVREMIPALSFRCKLVVVSNFKVPGGIEELLALHSLRHYFHQVVTSINAGWRKPHPEIYRAALAQVKISPEQVCFIGDNYECDYLGPRKLGIPAVLFDRHDKHPEAAMRIRSFRDFQSFVAR